MRARVVVVVALLLAGLVKPATADAKRILGALALGFLTRQEYRLSESEIAQLAGQAVQEIEGEYEVYTDPRRVSRIGEELIRAIPDARRRQALQGMTFKVLKNPADSKKDDLGRNALAVPTKPGTVYITSKYLGAGLSDDSLAFALGHEIGHLAKGHVRENLRRAGDQRGVIVGLLAATRASETWQEVASWGDFFLSNSYSQKQELEADEYGYRLLAVAGRNPEAAIEGLAKLRDGKEPPGWLNNLFNTHPLLSDRQRRLGLMGSIHSQPQNQPAANPNPANPAGPTTNRGPADPPIPPQRVAVVRLEVTGDYSEEVSGWLPDYITSRLQQAGWTVLERRNVEDVLREQDFGQSGRVDPRTAPGYGKVWGASHLIQLTARVWVRELWGGIGAQFGGVAVEGVRITRATLRLNGRVVDTTTGEVVEVAITGSSETRPGGGTIILPSDGHWVGGVFYISGLEESVVGRAADQAADRLVAKLTRLTGTTHPQTTELAPAVQFLGVGREVRLASEPLTLEVRAPKETAKVAFAVYDKHGNKGLEGESLAPPFSVVLRPEKLRGLATPLSLRAIALDRQGRELGRAETRLIPAH